MVMMNPNASNGYADGNNFFLLEGIAPSVSKNDSHVTISQEYLGAPTSFVNYLTVVDLELEIDGLSEAIENDTGAIIWRNSDFSKQNEQTAGGKILPDYQKDGVLDEYKFDHDGHATDLTPATLTWNAQAHTDLDILLTFPENLLVWDVTNWDSESGIDPPRIVSGEAYTPITGNSNTDNTLDLRIEGINRSAGFAQDQIYAAFVYRNMPWQKIVEDTAKFTVVEINAGVDGNRDGTIDFTNADDRQLTFWYNNDNETRDSDGGYERENVNPSATNNFDIPVIDGTRDLEDFSLLAMDLDPMLFANATNTANGFNPAPKPLSVTFELSTSDVATHLNVYHSEGDPLNAVSHVKDVDVAKKQFFEDFGVVAEFSLKEDSAEVELKSEYGGSPPHLRQPGVNGFLFEAFRADGALSQPELRLTAKITYPDDSETQVQRLISLTLLDVEEFYDTYAIDYIDPENGEDLRKSVDPAKLHFGDANRIRARNPILASTYPILTEGDDVVFVHGWNMPHGQVAGPDEFFPEGTVLPDWKRGFAETAFKRLYWQGFRGNFYSFEWPTFTNLEGPRDGQLGLDEALNLTYNPSEYQAFRSGQALKNFLSGLRSSPTHLLAHSMGNVVAAEALRQWSVQSDTALVANYVAMEAAFSGGAYGVDATDDEHAMNIDGSISTLEFWFGITASKRVRWDRNIRMAGFKSENAGTDFLRYFPQGFLRGEEGVAEPFSKLDSPYMAGSKSAASNWINMFNPDDSATNEAWRSSNLTKIWSANEIPQKPAKGITGRFGALFVGPVDFLYPPEIFPWRYYATFGFNQKEKSRVPIEFFRVPYTDEGDFAIGAGQRARLEIFNELADDTVVPGPDAYAAIAFMGVSTTPAIGNIGATSWFDEAINFARQDDEGLGIDMDRLGGADAFSIHSFQFHFDAATTAPFWEYIKDETSFSGTR